MPKSKTHHTIRLVLGDQLNQQHSWYKKIHEDIVYVFMEVKQESAYVSHHIQKVVAFFLAMRSFAEHLKQQGHQVIYLHINDPLNHQSFMDNLSALQKKYSIKKLEYQLPDEYRLDDYLKQTALHLGIDFSYVDTEHFLTTRDELKTFFTGKKTYLMESFYRYMRKKHNVLVQNGEPMFGKWNFDADNRSKLPSGHKAPEPLVFEKNIADILNEIDQAGLKTIGSVDPKKFIWPVNREESIELLNYFTENLLPHFGTFQDAMTVNQWSVYHSRISFSLNVKLLHPLEVIQVAINAWKKNPDEIAFHQLEGFVRQILGWREYMRGVYWAQMPEYGNVNYFDHQNELPQMYWTGKTKMNCMKQAIGQSLKYAYAHHIQRLMVTGNFALLAGVHPNEVDKWYLGIYIDAIEWVEITNTRGMSQFADGGLLATKPYVSSAAYIDKMSDYCKGCYYYKKKKTGDRACPFNSLYWNFFDKHRHLLQKNPRIGMMYSVWDKMDPKTRSEILQQAQLYLNQIHEI
jgi:deoxyribodipyrimidine photolyase-related protein